MKLYRAACTRKTTCSKGTFVSCSDHDSVSFSFPDPILGMRLMTSWNGMIISIDHNKFINNTVHSAFSNTVISSYRSVLYLDRVLITLCLNEFINNITDFAIVRIPYYTTAENLTDNVFIDSSRYELFISSSCRPDLGLSLGSSRCIPCSDNWH